jgi:hypothetical protein
MCNNLEIDFPLGKEYAIKNTFIHYNKLIEVIKIFNLIKNLVERKKLTQYIS